MNKFKKQLTIYILIFIFNTYNVQALSVINNNPTIDISLGTGVFIEEITGRIIFSKNGNAKMYPASTTKILTALVALEYLKENDVIKVGTEIYKIENDSSKAGHIVGESILVKNLIRGLLIPSGNDSACVLAKAVIEKIEGSAQANYYKVEQEFAKLMNKKARELGALNSNFVNPHGYHDKNHYTTAIDLAIISVEAMKNKTIKEIAVEEKFTGNGMGNDKNHKDLITKDYNWINHNFLISKTSEYYYKNATGLKTGYTEEAGSTLVATANKDGINLVSAIMSSKDPERFTDNSIIFEEIFKKYKLVNLADVDVSVDSLIIKNAGLGSENELFSVPQADFKAYLTKEELKTKKIIFEYNEGIFKHKKLKDGTEKITIEKSIAKGDVLGTVSYVLQTNMKYIDKETYSGVPIYKAKLVAKDAMNKRSVLSDSKYYLANMFTLKAIPVYLVMILIGLFIMLLIKILKKVRKNISIYKMKKPVKVKVIKDKSIKGKKIKDKPIKVKKTKDKPIKNKKKKAKK